MIVHFTQTRQLLPGLPSLAGLGVLRLFFFIFFLPFSFNSLLAQEGKSPVFPEDRHEELTQELQYIPDDPPEKEQEEPTETDDWEWPDWEFDFSDGTTIAIFAILIAILGFFIYRILGDISLRKRTRLEGEEDQEEINIDDIEEEKLVAAGVSISLLERAERAGQFDIAVRLLYIQLLKELQDGGLIKYRKDFSNRDYQTQLKGTGFLAGFREVIQEYERYWFGKYPIDRLSYRNTYQRFTALNERIRVATAKTSNDYV